MSELYDVVIVGAGPAGLSAALVLGRCCRRVLLCDAGRPRNAAARAMHGFLSRDGLPPGELRRLGREELARYPTLEVRDVEVTDVRAEATGGFACTLATGQEVRTRKLLLATGVVDELPPIPGVAALWGRGIHACPYCDAWEVRGQRLAVYGRGEEAFAVCRALTGWSRTVTLLCDGPSGLSAEEETSLRDNGIPIVGERVTGFTAEGDDPVCVAFAGRAPLVFKAVFLAVPQHQRSPLVERLGCCVDAAGKVQTGTYESTNVNGLFVAGDASRSVQFAIVAAAEGAQAAFAINRSLVREAFEREARLVAPPP